MRNGTPIGKIEFSNKSQKDNTIASYKVKTFEGDLKKVQTENEINQEESQEDFDR